MNFDHMNTDYRERRDASNRAPGRAFLPRLAGLHHVRLATAAAYFLLAAGALNAADQMLLQDENIVAAFDTESGALTRLENRSTHWAAEQKPDLGLSLRLTLLAANGSNHVVLSPRERSAEVQRIADNEVDLQWTNLVSEQGESIPITVAARVTLASGGLTFETTVTNHSPQMVESLEYPCLGNLSTASNGAPLAAQHMWYGSLQSGPLTSARTIESRQSLFCLIQSPAEGLYVEMHDPTQPYLLKFAFDRRGQDDATNSPSRVEFRAIHMAYVHPREARSLAPVYLHFYTGDWHGGVDLYKDWRATWFRPSRLPKWIQNVNAWQQLQIDSPEQDFRVPYRDLPAYGRECAANGVQAIQLVGWNHGGQDGGDPAQDTEPGLGSWQELHDAIQQIQALGVKIILFAKLNWADKTTAWDTNELYKYACEDPQGHRYEQGGYAYYTPTQLAGLNLHRRDVMDFLDPAYRDIATKEFGKILALGSEGWLWDEICHHADVRYNYASGHGYVPPGYVYGGDLPLAAQLRAAADKVNPDFLFAGEAPQDWLLPYFPCSYFRVNADSVPVSRYLDPQAPLMVAVTGFDDREILNLILMNRYIISYEPYNFKGHLSDYPLTLAYGKKIDVLRRRYQAYLWDGEFRDTLGAGVTADGAVRHTVFMAANGRRAVVVVNLEPAKTIIATVDLPLHSQLVVATPENPDSVASDGTLQIPARSAAVLMEQ